MKNIHLLATDKPTWLHKSLLSGILRKSSSCISDMKQAQGMNIYITSDVEIKEGDWVIDNDYDKSLVYKADRLFFEIGKEAKKIILTTDQDLIKDNVQSIDDEFLEWFIENPSCEEVEVIEQYRKCCRNTDGKNENCIESINCEGWLSNEYERPYKTNCDKRFEGYKIIIPKEETKQETLEEASKDYIENTMKFSFNSLETKTQANRMLKCAEFGAKWQQEQINNILDEYITLLKSTTEFEVLDSFRTKVEKLENLKR